MEALSSVDKCKTGLQTWLHALQTHTESRSSRFSSWFSRTGVLLDNFDQLSYFGSDDIGSRNYMMFFFGILSVVFFSFSLGSPSPSLNSSVASSPALAATVVEATEDTTDASINDSDPQGG